MSDVQNAKDQLIEQIQYVYETDVGDFKRKASLYLNRFIGSQTDPGLKKKVQNLRNFVLYKELSSEDEMENIDQLRFELIEQLKQL